MKHFSSIICVFSTAVISLATFFLIIENNNSSINGYDGLVIKDRADLELMMLRDPKSGRIPKNIRQMEFAFAQTLPGAYNSIKLRGDRILSTEWTRRGPYNIGGRTRALGIDIRNENIIIAGGVSGGMWRSTDGGATWNKTTKPGQLHSVSCLVQDVRSGKEDIWYAGTGELWGNSSGITGDGIYKSSDNGINWELIPSTSTSKPQSWENRFDYIWNIAVNPASKTSDGEIYAALALGSIMKSTDGGNTWKKVLGDFGNIYSLFTDIVCSQTGVLIATLSEKSINAGSVVKGIFRSTDGDNWTNITPQDIPKGFARVVPAIALSDENQVYFAAETPGGGLLTFDSYGDSIWHSFWKYTYISGDGSGSGGLWDNRSMNLPKPAYRRGQINSQTSYNLVLKVLPDDPNVVVLGATNLYVSKDGFKSGAYNWVGGYCPDYYQCPLFTMYSNHHPDLHAIVFSRSNYNILYTGSDGGLHKTYDIMADSVQWISLNNGYYTTQFYTIAIDHAIGGSDYILGGLQDNGSLFSNSTDINHSWTMPTFGDGLSCLIEDGGNTYYTSQNTPNPVKVKLWRLDIGQDGWPTVRARIDPAGGLGLIWNSWYGLDPNNQKRMYLGGGKILWRNNDLSQIPNVESNDSTKVNWDSLTATRIDQSNPIVKRAYDNTVITAGDISNERANIVYYGTSAGEVFKIENAESGQPQPVNVTSTKMPSNAFASCIKIDPENADIVYIVFSNYNVLSIFQTTNGGIDWQAISGNLEESTNGSGSGPACFWLDILKVGNTNVFFVGTSTGLYSTAFINGRITVWSQEGVEEIGNVVVKMLDTRSSDNFVTVATHGAGVFTTRYSSLPQLPAKPQLISPSNNTRGVKNNQLLEWKKSEDAGLYRLEISNSQNFDTVIYMQDGIKGTSATFTQVKDGLKDYYWRVASFNSGGMSQYSDIWTFRSVISPPELVYPQNQSDSIPLNITLQWQNLSDAKSYHLQVATNTIFSKIVLDTTNLASNSYELTGLEWGKKYHWRVYAIDDDGESYKSATWNFTTLEATDYRNDNNYSMEIIVLQNYPNPFNTSSNIKFINYKQQRIIVSVFNSNGKMVEVLADRWFPAGEQNIKIDAFKYPAGRFFYRIEASKYSKTMSFIVIK